MGKITAAAWPDPTDWAKRLYDRLESLGSEYLATSWRVADDPEAFTGLNFKQARAAEIVIAVAASLRELPSFETSDGVAVLHDVAGALHDVVMGGLPRLFTPVARGGPGGDGIDRNYLKVHVVLAVRFMVDAHTWKVTKAQKFVAEKFADAGATGRKGNRLSRSTVQNWCELASPFSLNADHLRIDAEVESHLAELRKNPQWPGNIEDSLVWIAGLASHPLLKSKYG